MPSNPQDISNLTDSQKALVLSIGLQSAQNDIKEVRDKVSEHEIILVKGDGKELPAMERIRNMETFISSQRYWARFIAGAILLQTITFASAAILYFVKLYPLLENLSKNP